MEGVTFLTRRTGMDYFTIMKLSYPIFLSYLKHEYIAELKSTEEGRKYLAQCERLSVKEADLSSLRQLAGYKAEGGER